MGEDEIEKLFGSIEDARKRREKSLPTEQHCLRAIHDAYQRLKELGWNDMVYAPKDEKVETISVGSTGIHPATWMDGASAGLWWIHDGGDLWPGSPVMQNQSRRHRPKGHPMTDIPNLRAIVDRLEAFLRRDLQAARCLLESAKRRGVDAKASGHEAALAEAESALADLSTLQARVVELEGALESFAKIGEHWESVPDIFGGVPDENVAMAALWRGPVATCGDFRRAARSLSSREG
jgi:hypothetical protein